jgi:hypothetical protein
MTAQRQETKGWGRRIAFIALLANLIAATGGGVGALVGSAFVGSALAATTERVVVDRFTGLAIEGFDPVAYFTDARPLVGRAGLELSQAGAIWRFRNEGNRAFFVADPEIYSPQFGGYDPVDVARGVAFAGNPRFWLISGERLYLFGREQSRDAFAAAPQRFVQEAAKRWPDIVETLAQ